jgi:anti-sigma-K factor RskA
MNGDLNDELREIDPLILGGLAQVVPQVEPVAELRSRVLDAIGVAAPDPRAAGRAPVAEARRFGTETIWRLATAALLAVAVGLTAYTAQLRNRISSLETDLRDANVRAIASQQQIADAQRTAAGAQSAVAVLTAADVARVDLAGQPAAPTASARAFWSRSRGLVFSGTNLPPLPAGRTYQLWVVTAQAPISAGLLRPDAQGGFNATFTTPPDIPQPVAIAVTIEPDGGVPAPTGDKFLVGTL